MQFTIKRNHLQSAVCLMKDSKLDFKATPSLIVFSYEINTSDDMVSKKKKKKKRPDHIELQNMQAELNLISHQSIHDYLALQLDSDSLDDYRYRNQF